MKFPGIKNDAHEFERKVYCELEIESKILICACVKCVSQPSGRERGCWLPVRLQVTAKIGKWGRLQGISDSKRLELALRTSGKI